MAATGAFQAMMRMVSPTTPSLLGRISLTPLAGSVPLSTCLRESVTVRLHP